MFSKTNLMVHNERLITLSPTEQEVFTEIQEKLDELGLLDNLPSEFTLCIEECSWPNCDNIEISPEAVSAITSLVLNRVRSLPVSFNLDFSLCNLGDEGAIALAEILRESSGTHLSIDLFGCDIQEAGFLAIAKSLVSEECKLSGLTLSLGQQVIDNDDESGFHDTINGQIQLIDVLLSPLCPDALVIDFKFLTADYADKIVKAMQFNTSCFIRFENQKSIHTKEVVLLNERNRLLKSYPAYKEQITSFCQKQLGFNPTANSTDQAYVLSLHTHKKEDEQMPQELVQFFSSILCRESDNADEAKILTIHPEPLSSHDRDNSITTIESLCSAINLNTDFTVFIKPQFPISSMEQSTLVDLLKLTALRNRLIKELAIEKNEKLYEPGEFGFQLLQALYDNKSEISSEISALAFQYFSDVLSNNDYLKIFGTGAHLIQSVKTGLLPLAKHLYKKLIVEEISDQEQLFLNAIESGSDQMMLWLSSTFHGKKFLNRETLNFAEQQLENSPNNSQKENLEKGLIIFKELLFDQENQSIQKLIESKDYDALQFFLNEREIAKPTLAKFLSLAISEKSNRYLLGLIIKKLDKHFVVNNLSTTEFIYLTNFGLVNPAQRDDFLMRNYSSMSKELTLQLIRKRNFPRQFLGLFIELHLNNLTSADIYTITQGYSLLFLQTFKQNLSEKYPENNIIKELIDTISELILKENSLRAQELPVLANEEIELSPNKRDFINYSAVSLTNNQVNLAAQSYQRRKKISIYVENYIPTHMQNSPPGYRPGSLKRDVQRVLCIQNELADNGYAGYLHVEGLDDNSKGHVECLIVTKTQIIKPIQWDTTHGVLYTYHYDRAASANLSALAPLTLIPQADGQSCASLSLSYLKQLLKDDAKQLKELCFIFPHTEMHSKELGYFFIPSPQVLRYSQSSTYNLYIKKLVTEDEPGFFIRKGKKEDTKFTYTPIKHSLMELQFKAKKEENFELVSEIESLLDQLPHFRKRWLHAYEQMDRKRSLMHPSSFNTGLQYTSRRMRKLALIEEENQYNPGLNLLTLLEEKKVEGYPKDRLLALFSEHFQNVVFERAYEIGYFINNLAKYIDCEAVYPLIFSYETNLSLLKDPAQFEDCLFFLDSIQRNSLKSFFAQKANSSSPQSKLSSTVTPQEPKLATALVDLGLFERTSNPEQDEPDSGLNLKQGS